MLEVLLSMTAYDWITQLLGIFGLCASVYSFQKNTHKGIMRLQFIAGCFFTANLFMLHAYTGALLNAVGILRAAVLYYEDKEWVKTRFVRILVAFCISFVICGAVGVAAKWETPPLFALVPAFAMVVNTFSFAAPKPKIVRATILIASPIWLYYDFVNGSVGGYVNETLVIISAVAGLIRYDIPWKKIFGRDEA